MSRVSGLQYKLYVSLGNCVVAADPPQKERLQLLNSVSPIFPPPSRYKLTMNSLSLSGVEDSVQTDRTSGTCVCTNSTTVGKCGNLLLCGNEQQFFHIDTIGSSFLSLQEYIQCTQVWMEYVAKHFTVSVT